MQISNTQTDTRSLLLFALPFILANLSHITLQITDRIMVGWYDVQAVAEISTMFRSLILILFTPTILLGITAMLSGKYNGAQQYHLTSKPIWQGIWIASVIGTATFIMSLSNIPKYILPQNCETYGLEYAIIIIKNAIFLYISSILSGYFYSIGYSNLVNYSMWISNITNIGLNYILIFKFDLGATGAAYATVCSHLLQCIILFIYFIFLDKKYNTLDIHFDIKEIKKIIFIGIPNASGHGIEMIAWNYIGLLVSSYGPNNPYMIQLYFTSTYQLPFRIFRTGIEKAIAAITANLIGAKKSYLIPNIITSSYKLYLYIMITISFLGIIFLDQILHVLNLTNIDSKLYYTFTETTIIGGLVMFFSGMASIYGSILTALHDTKFIMQANGISVWLFCIFPAILWSYYIAEPTYNFTLYCTLSYSIIYYGMLWFRYTYYHRQNI